MKSRESDSDHCTSLSVDLFIACAKHIVRHSPDCPEFIGAAGASEVGVCGQRGEHVSREVYSPLLPAGIDLRRVWMP